VKESTDRRPPPPGDIAGLRRSDPHRDRSPAAVCRVVAAYGLSAVLIGATMLAIVLSFRFGVDRGDDGHLTLRGVGHFRDSVCAILSRQAYGAGRYVCVQGARESVAAAGLAHDPASGAHPSKTVREWATDTDLNGGLTRVFSAPPLPDKGGVAPIGWGMDAGYADFVDLAFRVFGHKVEALYLTFFLLIGISTGLVCAQFFDRYLALFVTFSFQYVFFLALSYLPEMELGGINNPRLVSVLAIPPLLHAFFLIAEGTRPSLAAVLLFAPQAVLMVGAGHVRATAYWSVIAVGLCCALVVGVSWWRGAARRGLLRCWPGLVVLAALAGGVLLTTMTTDGRLASMGGMRGHALWQPLYYNLQTHPDWQAKYGEEHQGATGDATAAAAVASYMKRHPQAARKRDYVMRDRAQGLSQVGYERLVRAAYVEFVLGDPWYVATLKYRNAKTIVMVTAHYVATTWASFAWPFWVVAACVTVALAWQIPSKRERFVAFTWCVAAVVASAVLVAAPVWATVVIMDALFDTMVLAILASVGVVLWGAVSVVVLVSHGAAALSRTFFTTR
jgi:hypothetical protein